MTLRCRQIEEADLPAIAVLLARGFRKRSSKFWGRALEHLSRNEPPPSFPKYGYVIDSDGALVGVLLVICSKIGNDVRCNLSSWYVEPKFRVYAPLLDRFAHLCGAEMFLNVTPDHHTFPTIEAQGFMRYSNGVYVALPLLSKRVADATIVDVTDPLPKAYYPGDTPELPINYDPGDMKLLLDHFSFGCICIWCIDASGNAYPFVFRRRVVEHIIPCVQLIYCRDIADLVRFAVPIGQFLAWRGSFAVLVDANGPLPLAGRYFNQKMQKYFKGEKPRLGDLAYTEIAMFGV